VPVGEISSPGQPTHPGLRLLSRRTILQIIVRLAGQKEGAWKFRNTSRYRFQNARPDIAN
jgi:hypothetical protein